MCASRHFLFLQMKNALVISASKFVFGSADKKGYINEGTQFALHFFT